MNIIHVYKDISYFQQQQQQQQQQNKLIFKFIVLILN